jgi:hypothetical protein
VIGVWRGVWAGVPQFTSAYVSIRQHTTAYVASLIGVWAGVPQFTRAQLRLRSMPKARAMCRSSPAYVSIRQHTFIREEHAEGARYVQELACIRQHTSAYVSIRSYVSMGQGGGAHHSMHTPAYACIVTHAYACIVKTYKAEELTIPCALCLRLVSEPALARCVDVCGERDVADHVHHLHTSAYVSIRQLRSDVCLLATPCDTYREV